MFPTNPEEGQIYNNYKYDNSMWRKISNGYIIIDQITKLWTNITSIYQETVSLQLPQEAKAINVLGYSFQDKDEDSDHVHHHFGPNTLSVTVSYSETPITQPDVDYGSFILTHQGEISGDATHYGNWQSGIIHLNENNQFYVKLGIGHSGGTHHVLLKILGYYI